ncbi:MAG: hypothetical protein V3W44_10960 [Dehalococcoidales bacterium]
MKERKELTVPLKDHAKTHDKMLADGWERVGIAHAPAVDGKALMVFQRDKGSKPAPKTVATISVPKKSAKVKKKGKKKVRK